MIPKEVLKQIKRIQITTSRIVSDVFAGQYESVFKGRGIEFSEVREYQIGDDIRSIDWNVTARTGSPHVKKFAEERQLTVMLLLDASGSSHFGTVGRFKSQLAAEVCSVIAFSAIQNNDKVGLIIFTDRIEKFIPPKKGMRHVLRVIMEALYFTPEGTGTNISLALEYLNRVSRRHTISFIISDFFDRGYKKALSIANKKHDCIAITITDPREVQFSNVGIINLKDAETGEDTYLDTSSPSLREEYLQRAKERIKERNRLFASIDVDSIDLMVGKSYVKPLIRFFQIRQRRIH